MPHSVAGTIAPTFTSPAIPSTTATAGEFSIEPILPTTLQVFRLSSSVSSTEDEPQRQDVFNDESLEAMMPSDMTAANRQALQIARDSLAILENLALIDGTALPGPPVTTGPACVRALLTLMKNVETCGGMDFRLRQQTDGRSQEFRLYFSDSRRLASGIVIPSGSACLERRTPFRVVQRTVSHRSKLPLAFMLLIRGLFAVQDHDLVLPDGVRIQIKKSGTPGHPPSLVCILVPDD